MNNNQLQRISEMENRLDSVQEKVNALQEALDAYEACLPELRKLTGYYDSGLWREDYLDDENGRLPADLKRGVLSEDGIYDLLADIAALTEQMQRIVRP